MTKVHYHILHVGETRYIDSERNLCAVYVELTRGRWHEESSWPSGGPAEESFLTTTQKVAYYYCMLLFNSYTVIFESFYNGEGTVYLVCIVELFYAVNKLHESRGTGIAKWRSGCFGVSSAAYPSLGVFYAYMRVDA